MIFSCTALFSLLASFALAVKNGDFMEMNVPGHADHGKICVVENAEYYHPKEPTVRRVAVYCFHAEFFYLYETAQMVPKDILKYSALLENQLQEITPEVIQFALTDGEIRRLRLLVLDNLKHDLRSFRDYKIKLKHRLIGAWINVFHGFEGMVKVCDSTGSTFLRSVESNWNRIGDFQG